MTVKEYLQQVRKIDYSLKRLRLKEADITSMLYGTRSPSDLSRDRVQTSPEGDTMPRLLSQLDDIQRECRAERERLLVLKLKITGQIEAMPDERLKYILYARYICYRLWDDIALDLGVDVRHVYRMHGKALNMFRSLYVTK